MVFSLMIAFGVDIVDDSQAIVNEWGFILMQVDSSSCTDVRAECS